MTEIADYLGVPLNTATGIISRLEKRNVIKRERDVIDKRVVTIAICQEGVDFLNRQLKLLEHYYDLFMGSMSEDEKMMLVRLAGRLIDVVSKDLSNKEEPKENKNRVKKITIE
jgi:DNA-binding MarR family transcriptional regulator